MKVRNQGDGTNGSHEANISANIMSQEVALAPPVRMLLLDKTWALIWTHVALIVFHTCKFSGKEETPVHSRNYPVSIYFIHHSLL